MSDLRRVLTGADFASADTPALARSLLGKFLVVREASRASLRGWMITETEAYDGPHDRACHASKGRTARTDVMFGPSGIWYIYFIYGMHEMLNLVTGPVDYPAAILIRGVEGISGPGRLTRRLAIDRRLNRMPAAPESGLFLEDRGVVVPENRVSRGPRVGVDYAGPEWSGKPWRFLIEPEKAETS